MSTQDDRDFQQWTKEWQAGTPRDVTTEEQIRHYVKRRSGLLWSFMVSRCRDRRASRYRSWSISA